MAAHKHAEVIKAWADGAKVQVRFPDGWVGVSDPGWESDREYRVKPAEPERVYPVTQMSGEDLDQIWCCGPADSGDSCVEVANAALRHAVDAGQVVTREEFDRMCGDREARELAIARAVAERVANGMKESILSGVQDTSFNLLEIIAGVTQ